jgi:hypothetical protein
MEDANHRLIRSTTALCVIATLASARVVPTRIRLAMVPPPKSVL